MNAAARGHGTAQARAALAGNPSDGYGGAVLALALDNWRADALAMPASEAQARPSSPLVEATIRRFTREFRPDGARVAVQWSTDIPRSVGLGGSSAIVIATTRALCELYGTDLAATELAEFALAVEVEDLGIAAGPQDRVAQAYGGLTFMEFGGDGEAGRYESLDPAELPEMLIAWRPGAAAHSGGIHEPLRARHAHGERAVVDAMAALAQAARDARDALLTERADAFCAAVDRTFDLRARVMELDPLCSEMVRAARGAGAAANFTGSGGAVAVVARSAETLADAAAALRGIACNTAPASFARVSTR